MDETPLSLALIDGDMDIVKALVEAKSNVNHIGVLPGNGTEQKESLLSRLLDEKGSSASLDKRKSLVKFLIQNGADVNLDKEGVDSPLIKAVKLAISQKTGHQNVDFSLLPLNLVTDLLEQGSEINHRGKSLMTALHVCSQQECEVLWLDEEYLDEDIHDEDYVETYLDEDYLEDYLDEHYLEDDYSDKDQNEKENVDEDKDFSDTLFNLLLNSGASVNVQAKCGATPVHTAIRSRCSSNVLEMLNRDFEANTKDVQGVTCLMLAVEWGEEKIIKALIKCEADVKLEDQCGNTALHYLCSDGQNMELLDTLLENGSDINAVNKDGYSPLNTFVKKGRKLQIKDVLDLVAKGADPNCCSWGCESPLTNALRRRKYEIAKVLLKSGALINQVSDSGYTPLSMAVSKAKGRRPTFLSVRLEGKSYNKEREEIVDYLLEAGADANILTVNDTSLLCSLLSGPIKEDTVAILSNLLQHNANPNIGTENPLCLASKVSLDAVQLLLNAGANVNKKGSNGNTALVECLQSENVYGNKIKILKALTEAGADTNIASNTGKYPIEIVLGDSIVQSGRYFDHKETSRQALRSIYYFGNQTKLQMEKLVTLLLGAGAKCNQRKSGTDSPLHIAVAIDVPNVVKWLIAKGADVNHIGENQETPLHRYFKEGTQERKGDTEEKQTNFITRAIQISNSRQKSKNVLDILLSCKANPNTQDADGNTPLRLALKTNANDFRKLLAAGADPFFKGENLFEQCVDLDDFSFLDALLREKGPLFISDSLFSLFWERQSKVKLLKNKHLISNATLHMLHSPQELNVNRRNCSGNTPLLHFCEQNENVVVEKLLERGADVNMVDSNGRTALHIIFHSKDDTVRYQLLSLIMRRNPDVEVKDASGKTVFQIAEEEYQKHPSYRRTDYRWLSFVMKELLLAGGICQTNDRNALLVLASQRKHFGLMTVLVEKGADLWVKKDGKGIFHMCLARRYSYEEDNKLSYKEFLDFIRMYLKFGGRLDEVDCYGDTPLLLFLKHEMYNYDSPDTLVDLADEIVSILAYDKSTVTKRNNSGLSAIHIVSSKRWLSTMKILVSKGANLCEKDDKQNTCLHLCIVEAPNESTHDLVVYLVEKGVPVNQINAEKKSPLSLLAEKDPFSGFDPVTTVEYLLKRGAVPNLHFKNSNALVAALRSASIKVIGLLLDYHAQVNEIEDGPTALHVLFRCFSKYDRIRKGDKEYVIHRILEMGANVNAKDNDGRTALHLAIKAFCARNQTCNNESIIQQFLDFGADINALDNRRQTPLSVICETTGIGICSPYRASIGCCLLSKGADPNIDFALNECMGNTEYFGLSAEWKAFIQSLVEKGADPNLYRDGKPPLLLATKSGHSDIVQLFLEKGADVRANDQDKNTCLHLACDLKTESARNAIATLLLEHGCSVNKPNKSGTTPLSNLIKRMVEDADSMYIAKTETTTFVKIDLSLFNRMICGGVKINPALKSTSHYYRKSILATLVRNGFFGAAATLINCGYDFKVDEDFKSVDFSHLESTTISVEGKTYNRIGYDREKNEFLNVLKKYEETAEISLLSLCRNTIRTHLIDVGQGAEIESKIMSLPLPRRIKMYLALREYTQDFEQMQIEEKARNPITLNMLTLMDVYYGMNLSNFALYGYDSDVDEYIHYYGDYSDSDDYYY